MGKWLADDGEDSELKRRQRFRTEENTANLPTEEKTTEGDGRRWKTTNEEEEEEWRRATTAVLVMVGNSGG